MTGPIPPQRRPSIPTEYKGITFRSKLEADWARFLDVRKIKWEYEPKGRYVPRLHHPGETVFVLCDFWLPDAGQLLEVKGTWNAVERNKFSALAVAVELDLFVGGPQGRLGYIVSSDPRPDAPADLPVAVCAGMLAMCERCDAQYFAGFHGGTYGENDCRKCGAVGSLARYHVAKPSGGVLSWPAGEFVNEFDVEEWVHDWFYADFHDEEWL